MLAFLNVRHNDSEKLTDAFLQINKDDIWQYLETVPTPVDNYLGAIPQLTAVTHPWLRELQFVYFWLEPKVLLYIM